MKKKKNKIAYVYFVAYTEIDKDGHKYNVYKHKVIRLGHMITSDKELKTLTDSLMEDKSTRDIHKINITNINLLHTLEPTQSKVYLEDNNA
jgi:hypothetical protein